MAEEMCDIRLCEKTCVYIHKQCFKNIAFKRGAQTFALCSYLQWVPSLG